MIIQPTPEKSLLNSQSEKLLNTKNLILKPNSPFGPNPAGDSHCQRHIYDLTS